MKDICKAWILIIICGCNQSMDQVPSKKGIEKFNDTLGEHIVVSSNNYLERVIPTSGKFALHDLTKAFCLVFGIGKNEHDSACENINIDSLIGYIIDPTYEEFSNLRELRAQRGHIFPKNDSLPICQFDNFFLIPFTSHEERSHLTLWRRVSSDSILFDRLVQPAIESRYSNITSIGISKFGPKTFLLVYLRGGEGGENWDEQIIAHFDDDATFEIIAREGVGHCHDCGDWAKILLRTNSNGFEMIEIRDSMNIVNNRWEKVSRKSKLIRSVIVDKDE